MDALKLISQSSMKTEIPEINIGDTVKVHVKIKEGDKSRIQIFEGVVLKRQGGSNRETFTVRKSSNGVGVENASEYHRVVKAQDWYQRVGE